MAYWANKTTIGKAPLFFNVDTNTLSGTTNINISNYSDISGLSNELKQKLIHSRPASLAQASRIEGMTPAGLALILTSIRRYDAKKTA